MGTRRPLAGALLLGLVTAPSLKADPPRQATFEASGRIPEIVQLALPAGTRVSFEVPSLEPARESPGDAPSSPTARAGSPEARVVDAVPFQIDANTEAVMRVRPGERLGTSGDDRTLGVARQREGADGYVAYTVTARTIAGADGHPTALCRDRRGRAATPVEGPNAPAAGAGWRFRFPEAPVGYRIEGAICATAVPGRRGEEGAAAGTYVDTLRVSAEPR